MAARYPYGASSRRELDETDPRLVRVFESAAQILNIKIIEGARDIFTQIRNITRRASKTINSKHIPRDASGKYDFSAKSKAIDAAPYPVVWPKIPHIEDASVSAAVKKCIKDTARFYFLAGVVKGIAHEQGLAIRQGMDWDGDGDFFDQSFDDLPHTEVDEPLPELVLDGELLADVNSALRGAGLPEYG